MSVYNAEFSGECSIAYDYFLLRFGPLSKYSPVTLHLSPATNILNENPARTWHLPSYDFQPIHPPTAPLNSLPTSGSRARSLGV